jgi:dTDP-4-dehydrorhamnose reductase
MKKVLVTGANGQLGWELQRFRPEGVELVALSRQDLDISDTAAVSARVAQESPDWIINAAAYTAVDKAESEVSSAEAINVAGAKNLALAARETGARLVHVSTDFVFDGEKSRPYQADDNTNPRGVYGETKCRGEEAVSAVLEDNALILRTAWVYSSHGNNFVKTMLRLMNERDELGVVEDQVGTPTWAAELARVIYMAIDQSLSGTYHWTDMGVASWYDFAQSIYEIGRSLGLTEREVTINPIPTEAYPTPAARPAYSVLSKDALRHAIGYNGIHWRTALTNMLKEVKNG